jgi:phosphate transport system protein
LLIALRAPAAQDLRVALSVIKISASLERVGDYAKNIGKRSKLLMQMPQIAGATGAIRRMAMTVEEMLKDALDSYIQRDTGLAADVRERDLEVDQMYNALFREFLTYMMEDPRNITPCMHLHFIAKNIERMGDHATSIAEQVIYLVTGQMPDEARPKTDSVAAFSESEE